MAFLEYIFNRKESKNKAREYKEKEESFLEEEVQEEELETGEDRLFWQEKEEPREVIVEEEKEYEVVEREILPEKIICPDCGGITLEGLDFCDKCGGELRN